MDTVTHAPYAHQLQEDAIRYAREANHQTAAALRHTLAGNHTRAAVARVMAQTARGHLRLTARAHQRVALEALAGLLAGEGLTA